MFHDLKDVVITSSLLIIITSLLIYIIGHNRKHKLKIKKLQLAIRNIAHDLRNPLSAIKNLVYSLSKKTQLHSSKDILDLISDACINAMALIKELITVKSNKQNNRQITDIGKLLEYSVSILIMDAEQKHQKLILQSTDTIAVNINPIKIGRVFANIINNAIKFSPLDETILVTLEKHLGKALVTVKDNGKGISADCTGIKPKSTIFELRDGTAAEKPHGLGLPLCRAIIKEYKGNLWCENSLQGGAIFYISLPCSKLNLPGASKAIGKVTLRRSLSKVVSTEGLA